MLRDAGNLFADFRDSDVEAEAMKATLAAEVIATLNVQNLTVRAGALKAGWIPPPCNASATPTGAASALTVSSGSLNVWPHNGPARFTQRQRGFLREETTCRFDVEFVETWHLDRLGSDFTLELRD